MNGFVHIGRALLAASILIAFVQAGVMKRNMVGALKLALYCQEVIMPRTPPIHNPRRPKAKIHRLPTPSDGWARWYKSKRWRSARAWYLRHNPLCVTCEKEGRLITAKVVDHIVPRKGDFKLFWDIENWQGLCVRCHNRKTATEDGGFGRKPRPKHPLPRRIT